MRQADKLVIAVLLGLVTPGVKAAIERSGKNAAVVPREHGPIIGSPVWTVFSPDDYPTEAIRAQEEGRVSVVLQIDKDGKVIGCGVDISSGSVALDRTTCDIATKRLHYAPATDKRGRPVASTTAFPVRWALPSDSTTPIVPVAFTRRVELNVDGSLRSCQLLNNGVLVTDALSDAICHSIEPAELAKLRAKLPVEVQAGPIAIVRENRKDYTGFPAASGTSFDGMTVVSRSVFQFTIHADGTVSDCAVDGVRYTNWTGPAEKLCKSEALFVVLDQPPESAQPGREVKASWTWTMAVRSIPPASQASEPEQ